MVRAHPCTGCRYFFGAWEHTRCCNYIFVAGHKRPCPPGEGCKVKDVVTDGRESMRRFPGVTEKKRRYEKMCLWCGRTFSTTRSDKLYCCEKCRVAARHKRKYKSRKERL